METIETIQVNADGAVGYGSVAQRLLSCNMDIRRLRPYIGRDGKTYVVVYGDDGAEKAVCLSVNSATLRYDEWKYIDKAVIDVARSRLRLVNFMRSRGLTLNMGGRGLAATLLQYEKMSDMTGATLSMDGLNRGLNDRPVFDIGYLPLPIIHKDWSINARLLAMSRAGGSNVDATGSEVATRKVAETAENMLVNGSSAYSFGGGIIYGLTDFPQRNQYDLIDEWDGSNADPVGDVRAMKAAAGADHFHGPFALLVPKNYEEVLDEDYTGTYPKTMRQRISEIDGIVDISVSDWLQDDNVVLFQLTTDVFRVVDGLDVTPVEWMVEGGMALNYKTMAIIVPQPRADYNGNCGIVHGAPA
jgi:uncharacterized linocin/CFP29 family protein